MNLSREAEAIYNKLKNTFKGYYPSPKEIDLKKYIEQVEIIKNFNQNSVIVLFDAQQFALPYISPNVEKIIGYSSDEIMGNPFVSFMNILSKEHYSYMPTIINWHMGLLKKLSKIEKNNQKLSSWGLKLIHKNGKAIRCFLNYTILELDENDNPAVFLIAIDDITYLIKSEGFWIRGVFGDERKIFTYSSVEEKTLEQDIRTDREKEILGLIADGFDTKQIAQKLEISPNTVDNHRRNMLNRTGIRDTTALVQLCKMIDF